MSPLLPGRLFLRVCVMFSETACPWKGLEVITELVLTVMWTGDAQVAIHGLGGGLVRDDFIGKKAQLDLVTEELDLHFERMQHVRLLDETSCIVCHSTSKENDHSHC